MICGDMYEFPDGTVGSNAGDCAQAWADEARSLRAEVEAMRTLIAEQDAHIESMQNTIAQVTAENVMLSELEDESEGLKADVSDLLRYLPALVLDHWREDKPATSRRIEAALRGEVE